MKKLFHSIWISLSCIAVMILTAGCIAAFYVAVAYRKIFVKDFTPNALKGADEEDDEVIGSAKSHLNAVQATLDKTEAQSG